MFPSNQLSFKIPPDKNIIGLFAGFSPVRDQRNCRKPPRLCDPPRNKSWPAEYITVLLIVQLTYFGLNFKLYVIKLSFLLIIQNLKNQEQILPWCRIISLQDVITLQCIRQPVCFICCRCCCSFKTS